MLGVETTNTTSRYELVPDGEKTDSVKPWMVFGLYGTGAGVLTGMYGGAARLLRLPHRRRKLAKKDLKRMKKDNAR